MAKDRRILIIGKTGVGKSTVGNKILGENVFESILSPESITGECRYSRHTRFDRSVLVVDTPGLFDTKQTHDKVLDEISKCYWFTNPGFHVVIMIRRLERLTDEETNVIEMYVKFFGKDVIKYMIIVFSSNDKNYISQTRDYVAKLKTEASGTSLSILLGLIEDRYIPFCSIDDSETNNTDVQNLLDMIDKLVEKNNNSFFTNANYVGIQLLHVTSCNSNFSSDSRISEVPRLSGSSSPRNIQRLATPSESEKKDGSLAAKVAQSAMESDQERDAINDESTGILSSIRKLLQTFVDAYRWIRNLFRGSEDAEDSIHLLKTNQ